MKPITLVILLILSMESMAGEFNITVLGDGFLYDEQEFYEEEVNRMIDYVNTFEPFSTYSINFNIKNIISNESGVTNDPLGVIKNTALGAHYYRTDNPRSMSVNVSNVFKHSDTRITIVVVNSYVHGGSTKTVLSENRIIITTPMVQDILLHELGHAIGRLPEGKNSDTVMGGGIGFDYEQQEILIQAITTEMDKTADTSDYSCNIHCIEDDNYKAKKHNSGSFGFYTIVLIFLFSARHLTHKQKELYHGSN